MSQSVNVCRVLMSVYDLESVQKMSRMRGSNSEQLEPCHEKTCFSKAQMSCAVPHS